MIEDAIAACAPLMPRALRQTLTSQWLREARDLRVFTREVASRSQRPFVSRAAFLAGRLLEGSVPAREYLKSRLPAHAPTDWVRHRLRKAGVAPLLLASHRRRAAGRRAGLHRLTAVSRDQL
jgi:hypothetical protein